MLQRCVRRSIATNAVSVNEALLKKLRADLKKEQLAKVSINRSRAFMKAMDIVSKLEYELTNAEMVATLHGIGPTSIKRIQSYLPSSGPQIPKAQREKIVKEIASVDGLSHISAGRLVDAGCRSKADLSIPKYFNLLKPAVQSTVRFASHLEKPVTRKQTETFAEFLREHLPGKYEVIPVGSYRRGAETHTCVRILLHNTTQLAVPTPPSPRPGAFLPPASTNTRKVPTSHREIHLYNTVVPFLADAHLSVCSKISWYNNWNGIVRVPARVPTWKDGKKERWENEGERKRGVRLGEGEFVYGKIFMLPTKSRGAALLHNTGSKVFLRALTHQAEKLGLYFSQTGLWKWHPDPDDADSSVPIAIDYDAGEGEGAGAVGEGSGSGSGEAVEAEEAEAKGFWQLLPSMEEEEIFDQLGMEYVPPEKRN